MFWHGATQKTPVDIANSKVNPEHVDAKTATPSQPRRFSLAKNPTTSHPMAEASAQAVLKKDSSTSGTDGDEGSDCEDSEVVMSTYQSLPGPPEGEEDAPDIGQDFNPHLPPTPTATSSAASADLAAPETLPPLPNSPAQKADDDRRSRTPKSSNKVIPAIMRTTPKIRIVSPSTSSGVTVVSGHDVRSTTGSIGTIHSLPESIVRTDQIPTDSAVYEHYKDIADLRDPVAESSKMAAERAALQGKYNESVSENSSNLDKRSFLQTVRLSERAAAAIHKHNKRISKELKRKTKMADRDNKKVSRECERQVKFEARTAKHRNSSVRPSTEKGKGKENARDQDDGSTESDPTFSNSLFNPATFVSRFRPAAQNEPPSPGPSFRRVVSQVAEDWPTITPSDQVYETGDPKHPRQSHYRQHVKRAFKKSIRHSRRVTLRGFILKLLLGRDTAEVVRVLNTRKAREGDLDGVDTLIDLAENLDAAPPPKKTEEDKPTEKSGRSSRKARKKQMSTTILDVDYGLHPLS